MKIDFINEGRIYIDIRDLASIFNRLLDNHKLDLDNETLRYVNGFVNALEISVDAAEELGRTYIEVNDKDFFELKKALQKMQHEEEEVVKKEEVTTKPEDANDDSINKDEESKLDDKKVKNKKKKDSEASA